MGRRRGGGNSQRGYLLAKVWTGEKREVGGRGGNTPRKHLWVLTHTSGERDLPSRLWADVLAWGRGAEVGAPHAMQAEVGAPHAMRGHLMRCGGTCWQTCGERDDGAAFFWFLLASL
eukprot:353448-Chlamydomonas_euryale.AAC.2